MGSSSSCTEQTSPGHPYRQIISKWELFCKPQISISFVRLVQYFAKNTTENAGAAVSTQLKPTSLAKPLHRKATTPKNQPRSTHDVLHLSESLSREKLLLLPAKSSSPFPYFSRLTQLHPNKNQLPVTWAQEHPHTLCPS